MAAVDGRQASWVRRLWLMGIAVGFVLLACSDRSSRESVGHSSQALTSAQQRILGFESVGAGSSDWSTTSGTLSQAPRSVEGVGSLAVANSGSTTLTSAALSSLGPVADKLTVDLLLPATQPNPSWMGSVKLVIESPSLQLWYEGLAEHQLQGKPTDQFLRFEFPLSESTRQKLSTGTYSDLRFKILLNVATGPGPWLLDRLWVSEPNAGGTGGTGGIGGAAGGAQGGSGGSTSSNDAILGFENSALWSTTGGVVSASDTHIEGSKALRVAGLGYAELTSSALSTLSSVGSVAGFDLRRPVELIDPEMEIV